MAPNNTLNSIIVKKKIVTTSGMRVRVKYLYMLGGYPRAIRKFEKISNFKYVLSPGMVFFFVCALNSDES